MFKFCPTDIIIVAREIQRVVWWLDAQSFPQSEDDRVRDCFGIETEAECVWDWVNNACS